jgi:hypothetical protein
MKFVDKIRSELEAPRAARVFGSGWISGSLALLAGIVGFLMVVVLRNPSLTSVPQLAVVHQSVLFRLALYFVLVSGFVLAALSLVLRRDKTLGTAAMVVTPDGKWPVAYGVAGHPVPRGYWKQLLYPFRR